MPGILFPPLHDILTYLLYFESSFFSTFCNVVSVLRLSVVLQPFCTLSKTVALDFAEKQAFFV